MIKTRWMSGMGVNKQAVRLTYIYYHHPAYQPLTCPLAFMLGVCRGPMSSSIMIYSPTLNHRDVPGWRACPLTSAPELCTHRPSGPQTPASRVSTSR